VPLQGQSLRYCDYGNSNNPPILHRKEQFIHSSHPLRATFAALTKEEIDAGLYAEPSRIGTRLGWARALSAHGCAIVDHVLHRDQGEPGAGEISDPESTTRSPCVELRSGLQH
jgi:hypothetical protein